MLQEAAPVSMRKSLRCSRPSGRPRSEHTQLTFTSPMARWTCQWTWGARPSVSLLRRPTYAHLDLFAAGARLVWEKGCACLPSGCSLTGMTWTALCRIVLGKDLRVKGLVGLSSLRRDAEERGDPTPDRWYEEAQGSDSEVTGTHTEHPKGQLSLVQSACDCVLHTVRASIHCGWLLSTCTKNLCHMQVASNIPLPLLQPLRMWRLSWQAGAPAQAFCLGSPSWPPYSSHPTSQGKPHEPTHVSAAYLEGILERLAYIAYISFMCGTNGKGLVCASR